MTYHTELRPCNTPFVTLCCQCILYVVCTLVTMAGSTMSRTLTALLCLGLLQGPWDQIHAGVPPKPSIWADPGPIVSKGSPVTIWCQGSLQADGYILYKERNSEPWMTSIPEASIKKTGFLIQSMSSQNAGPYQCAYSTGGSLSQLSEPLLLVVAGEHSAPSLSAHPGLVVASGENVSLLCSSQSTWDTFHLLKERGAEPPQHRKSEWRSSERRWQAVFPVGPVSSSHGGTYRCYGSSNSTPNVWSQSSDPLHLGVTGLPLSLNVLIGVSVALVLLLSLLLFLFLHHQRQSRGRTSADAAMKDPLPGQGVELDPQNGPHDNSKEVTYAQVNCRSRLRQGMAASPSPLSEELLDTKGRQAEEDRQMDSQAAASADPQDVTYAQLTLMTRRQETSAPPSSPSEKPPEPSVYAALAVH
ncbi:leukocyte immunoglobulin-like receptor subfamily B member 4 isoform X3 [Desmodus rotundus]|uniref:leukocyte immunoglobulin-like receptor subfamily B member 4 isoform X3 n=1 Tax=Desmodus rotundus TaxID=9430 RepID=UPI0023817DB6|nr:leukocyte immunoglobulin-like receptor subfamily B member 4 isoform X3 [Desmodus rotundus]